MVNGEDKLDDYVTCVLLAYKGHNYRLEWTVFASGLGDREQELVEVDIDHHCMHRAPSTAMKVSMPQLDYWISRLLWRLFSESLIFELLLVVKP